MMELDELSIRLQMLRHDLTADIISPEIEKLDKSTTISATDHLRACIRLAMLGQPYAMGKTNQETEAHQCAQRKVRYFHASYNFRY